MSEQFYVTTPIYYVNGKPHIGHAYTTIAGDVLKRYHEAQGKEVFLQVGVDENAQKNAEVAAEKGMAVQAYVDKMSAEWKQMWDDLGIEYTDFIRTTEDRHKAAVEQFWKAVEARGDIYKGEYVGLYCVGCEEFKTELQLEDGLCPDHKRAPEELKEENYFFKLSAYRDQLVAHFEANPDFVQPKSRRNEILNYIKDHMEDVSISRQSLEWGIPVPGGDGKDVLYVWFDALINYLSVVGYGTDEVAAEKWWPAQVQLVGKDIIKFHCALWPAMLMSAGLPVPEKVFAHGHFTVDGQKMSKSIGNVVDPREMSEKYGHDVLRYYLLREISFGADGDFSEDRLRQRYTDELANGVGNLLSRVTNMVDRYMEGVVEAAVDPAAGAGYGDAEETAYHDAMQSLAFHKALDAIWKLVGDLNEHIEQNKPWELAKSEDAADTERLQTSLAHYVSVLTRIGELLKPIMPSTSEAIVGALSGDKIEKTQPLFPRLPEPEEAQA